MSKKSNTSAYYRVYEARKTNNAFNQFLGLCEKEIACWIDRLNVESLISSHVSKSSMCKPESTRISILLPLVPLSSDERILLLNYLKEKYLNTRIVGGDYFELEKCLFKRKYKLSSYYINWEE